MNCIYARSIDAAVVTLPYDGSGTILFHAKSAGLLQLLTYEASVTCSAGHSVLVAAHTSAGKTVVAEYAFAMALRYQFKSARTSFCKQCLIIS